MSNHSKALVPLESWCYNSPDVKYAGKSVDIGLLAEALIYYDQVLINVANQPQFAEFINWFVAQKKYSDLISLFQDETIVFYEYSFATAAVLNVATDSYIIVNLQDAIQEHPNTFEQRFLYHESLGQCFNNSRERKRLYKALRGKVIEVKAKDFGSSIENAKTDYLDTKRSALLVQSFIDEVYPLLKLGDVPSITATVEAVPNGQRTTYNINFFELSKLLGKNLNYDRGAPLTGMLQCNRFIWSAVQENCDLYLGDPMANLVGDKLYESHLRNTKVKENIGQLNQEVEFPNIRKLVNDGKLDLPEILRIRKKSKKFRDWLQTESDRDRNAIIAYHNEVTKEAGIISMGRKTLRMFGILGIPIAGAFAGKAYPEAALITGSVSAGVKYLVDVASKIGENWKPVVFGNWVRNRIEKVLKEQD